MGGDQARLHEAGSLDLCEEDLPDLGFRWSRYICSWPRLIHALIVHRPGKADQLRARLKMRADELLDLDPEALETVELARRAGRSLYENLREVDLFYLFSGGAAAGVLGLVRRRWLDDKDLTLTYRLFAAQGGIADTEAGLDLWRPALLGHQDKETQALVLSGGEWRAVHQKLAETPSGRDFLACWDRFMAEHGHHCRGELELGNPRWSETPDYILGVVRGYLRSVGQTDPLANQQRLAAQRRDLTEQCRRRLRNPLKRRIFNWALANSQKLAADRENWKNVVVRQIAGFRRLVLALGERLRSQGVLSSRDDVFFLELPELEPVAQGRADFDVRGRIAERRAEYEKNRALSPPPVVAGRFDPARHLFPQIAAGVKVLRGIAVSPGVVTGKARVILRTDDHEHVEAGEILVAPFTDPAWTPYFLPAVGVVMDQGGVLSHGAIIAREYGLPAVVNVGPASRLIRTGQTIRVDGDRGTVTILDDEIRSTKPETNLNDPNPKSKTALSP